MAINGVATVSIHAFRCHTSESSRNCLKTLLKIFCELQLLFNISMDTICHMEARGALCALHWGAAAKIER